MSCSANLSGIVEHMLQCDDDSVDITPSLEEPKWLTECQFSDDIKSIFWALLVSTLMSHGKN